MTTAPLSTSLPYRAVRQREIAALAGVSVSTVSRVLSGSTGIGTGPRARVLEAARQLGHPSSGNLDCLRHLGLFVSDWHSLPKSRPFHPFHADILAGAEAECRARGIQLSFSVIDPQSDGEALVRQSIERGRLDALLLFELDDSLLLERILGLRLPTVVINAEHPGIPVDIVVPDNEGGSYLVANHLIEHGHSHILHITDPHRPTIARRSRGFTAGLRAAGLSEEPDVMLVSESSEEHVGEEVLRRLSTRTPDFTAIFCWHDAAAMHVMRALQSKGYELPRDISIVGFNDLSIANFLSPPLTTVRIEREELGRVAVRRLVERAQHPSLAPVQFNVATRLIKRQSVTQARS